MRKRFAKIDLIFFDPDNGLEVKSVRCGASKSSKYIYWREVSEVYRTTHSVLVYQHFCREERGRFVTRIAERLKEITGALELYSFSTSHVAFFLVPQEKHGAYFGRVVPQVQETWRGQFEVRHHD
jgi:hypothetical protein